MWSQVFHYLRRTVVRSILACFKSLIIPYFYFLCCLGFVFCIFFSFNFSPFNLFCLMRYVPGFVVFRNQILTVILSVVSSIHSSRGWFLSPVLRHSQCIFSPVILTACPLTVGWGWGHPLTAPLGAPWPAVFLFVPQSSWGSQILFSALSSLLWMLSTQFWISNVVIFSIRMFISYFNMYFNSIFKILHCLINFVSLSLIFK